MTTTTTEVRSALLMPLQVTVRKAIAAAATTEGQHCNSRWHDCGNHHISECLTVATTTFLNVSLWQQPHLSMSHCGNHHIPECLTVATTTFLNVWLWQQPHFSMSHSGDHTRRRKPRPVNTVEDEHRKYCIFIAGALGDTHVLCQSAERCDYKRPNNH